MSSGSFVIALGIGAALLAFWVQFRFPNLAPQTFGWAIVHLVVTGVLAQLTKAVFGSVELQPAWDDGTRVRPRVADTRLCVRFRNVDHPRRARRDGARRHDPLGSQSL